MENTAKDRLIKEMESNKNENKRTEIRIEPKREQPEINTKKIAIAEDFDPFIKPYADLVMKRIIEDVSNRVELSSMTSGQMDIIYDYIQRKYFGN